MAFASLSRSNRLIGASETYAEMQKIKRPNCSEPRKEEANSGSDPDVKKFADDTAKVIQEDLNLAKQTQANRSNKPKTSSSREIA
jgi:hypothetical protein